MKFLTEFILNLLILSLAIAVVSALIFMGVWGCLIASNGAFPWPWVAIIAVVAFSVTMHNRTK